MIGESGMNLSELKFMFVEHFKYCSKATFYNYLKELELERGVILQELAASLDDSQDVAYELFMEKYFQNNQDSYHSLE